MLSALEELKLHSALPNCEHAVDARSNSMCVIMGLVRVDTIVRTIPVILHVRSIGKASVGKVMTIQVWYRSGGAADKNPSTPPAAATQRM